MKVKYFLRGLGIGIFITALILGISYNNKLSDDSVITRAKMLGMDFDNEPEVTDAPQTTVDPEETMTPESSEIPAMTMSPDITANPESTDADTAETVKPDNNSDDAVEKINIKIDRGAWSSKVSEKLESLGVVDDAAAFDKYLIDEQYAQKIKVGEFSFSKDMTYEDIAKIITKEKQ